MSATEPQYQEQPPELGFPPATEAEIYTLTLYDQGMTYSLAETPDQEAVVIRAFDAQADRLPPDQAEVMRSTWRVIQGGVDNGEITAKQVPDFLRWLRWDQDVPAVTATLLAGGAIAGALLTYAERHGYVPVGGVKPKPPPKLPSPTPGQTSVARAAKGVVNRTVTAPGLDKAQTEAVSKAIGIATADTLGVVARSFDAWLAPCTPGEVPQALGDLTRAARVLEHQMAGLLSGTNVRGLRGLERAVHGMGQAVNGLEHAVHEVRAELADKAPSGLSSAVDELGLGLGTLAGTVGALETTAFRRLDHFEAQFARTEPSILGDELGHVSGVANTAAQDARQALAKLALTTDECLAQLCDDQASVTNPIKEGGASPSLLKHLGGVLKRAFELGFLATLADGLFTVLDAKASVQGVVQDSETLTAWATSAADAIASDLAPLGWTAHA